MWTVGSRASVGCAQEERKAGSPAASTLSTSSLDPPLRAAKDGCTHLHRNVVVDEEREGLGTNVAGTEVHDDLGVVGGETTGDWDGVSVRFMSMVLPCERLACAVGPTRAGAKYTRRRRVAAGRVLVSLIWAPLCTAALVLVAAGGRIRRQFYALCIAPSETARLVMAGFMINECG